MALLPPSRSPWWLLVFIVTATAWTGALLAAGYLNSGTAPAWSAALTAAKVVGGGAGALALLGSLGARRTFACAHLGLVVGYALLLNSISHMTDGWADLAGVATFLMCGAIGLAVGLLADLVAYLRRRA